MTESESADASLSGAEIGAGTRQLCEALADRLDAATGKVKIELFLTDGSVNKVRRSNEFGAFDLAQFDSQADRWRRSEGD